MLFSLLLLACSGSPGAPSAPAGGAPQGAPRGPPPPGSPQGPPPGGQGPNGMAGVSGAKMQDPSGFPHFHDQPAPEGPAITGVGTWGAPVKLTETKGGGYRPQVAAGPDGLLHALYYERTDAGDLIRHRTSRDGATWTAPAPLGLTDNRNWGPDLVARADGSVVVVFDHARADFSSVGYVTTWRGGTWSTPEALTADDGGEIGSGHVADAAGDQLAYVWIGKPMSPTEHFRARWRWFKDGAWSAAKDFTDGAADAWHTNVERRPDGSVLAGYDVGTGGAETVLYVVEGRDGAFGTPENLSASSTAGERPHFAFGADGTDHLTYFRKEMGRPMHVYVRSGKPGAWAAPEEPSTGYGGYHFDPDIAINKDGVRCLVWGWDAGEDAEMVYSLNRGSGWEPPKKIADIDYGKPGLASIVDDATGAFHIVWNQGVRGQNEVYYARLTP